MVWFKIPVHIITLTPRCSHHPATSRSASNKIHPLAPSAPSSVTRDSAVKMTLVRSNFKYLMAQFWRCKNIFLTKNNLHRGFSCQITLYEVFYAFDLDSLTYSQFKDPSKLSKGGCFILNSFTLHYFRGDQFLKSFRLLLVLNIFTYSTTPLLFTDLSTFFFILPMGTFAHSIFFLFSVFSAFVKYFSLLLFQHILWKKKKKYCSKINYLTPSTLNCFLLNPKRPISFFKQRWW